MAEYVCGPAEKLSARMIWRGFIKVRSLLHLHLELKDVARVDGCGFVRRWIELWMESCSV